MTENKKTVIHLLNESGDKICSKCSADLTNDGAYTFLEKVYDNPPPGLVNCKSMWAE